MKERRLPTSFSRSSWGVGLQINLMFAASSVVIVRSESFSVKSWEKFYYIIKGRGGGVRVLLVLVMLGLEEVSQ